MPSDQSPARKTPTRFAVLGTGHWARTTHARALADHPDVEFAGFWGRDADRTAAAAAEFGAGSWSGDEGLADLLRRVEAVTIALPPDVQADLAVRAADAGVHVLLDKPVATDLAAADRLVDAVRRNGIASVEFLTYLFMPEITDWLERMAALAAEHGPWEGGVFRWAGTLDAPGNPYAHSRWRRERGGLWDTGPHALSIARPLVGDVVAVAAGRGPRDAVNVALEHRDGAGTALSLTLTAPEGTGGSFATVWGPGGRHDLPRFTGTAQEGFARALDRLRAAAATGVPDALDVRHGRDAVAVLAAVETHLRRPDGTTPVAPAQS
ncbi:Gfo/Idh/MocA family protein [Kineococcus sp. LSe6-4]|uniref:Gfo/Idh/MocA family protein n=1 Tax=Kineococcus halophytocola TaxID=3234027 RepID=A0ABV4GZ79_9ACTN